MDIETAKSLVGAALIVAVAAFSVVTLSSAAIDMLRDLRILPPRADTAPRRHRRA
ncbi:hypothetical protein G3T14_12035 [Methylobacterium sp. BTF04]|uniref:hypothetical protein n=1 Tax=Methylobacterium sp. BTF04 TaxID=2708300 RepID=UPI0013CF75E6|nr:hypothetical protein [Methylobacterium sp. BTF04]NEU12862.1 hypothetical protein [Methylobacterium sp. BTF04]